MEGIRDLEHDWGKEGSDRNPGDPGGGGGEKERMRGTRKRGGGGWRGGRGVIVGRVDEGGGSLFPTG